MVSVKINEKNKEKIKEYNKKYKEKNKEKIKEYNKKYKEKNKEKINENRRKKYKEDNEAILIGCRKYREKNRELINERQKENRKEKDRSLEGKLYYEKNKEKIKEYAEKNKEKINERRKLYREKNKEKIREYNNNYRKNRIKNDELFKLRTNIRTLISMSINKMGYNKNTKTESILGCTFEEFKVYLESKFESWMNWNNYGLYNGEPNYGWDIDHIIPVSTAENEIGMIELNHHTNLQPLCSKVNRYIKKNNL